MIRTASLLTSAALMLAGCQQSTPTAPGTPAGTATSTTAAAATSPAGKKWSETVRKTPEGGFLMGNPDAKVKLVEYGSLTCSHCAEFAKEGEEALVNNYVNTGKVSYEFRNFVLNALDIPASLIVRCAGEDRFFPLTMNTFAGQEALFQGAQGITKESEQELKNTPQAQIPAKIAKLAKIDEFYKARGMSDAEINQCLAKTDDMSVLEKMNNEAVQTYKVTGTPAFFVNGKPADIKAGSPMWPQLEAILKSTAG